MFKKLFSNGNDTKNYSVFVLSGESSTTQKIVEIIREADYQVQSVADGQAAILLLDQPPLPDLIILDLLIPDMDAAQFLETIRQRLGRIVLPSVLLLGSTKEDETIAHTVHVEDYMQKPFESEELLIHVWNLLDKKVKI